MQLKYNWLNERMTSHFTQGHACNIYHNNTNRDTLSGYGEWHMGPGGGTCIQSWTWCSYKKRSKNCRFFFPTIDVRAYIEKSVKTAKFKMVCFSALEIVMYVFRV